jgi:hypothetical protein
VINESAPISFGEPRVYSLLLTECYNVLSGKAAQISEEKLMQASYACWHGRSFSFRDQVFHGLWRNLSEYKKVESGWCRAIIRNTSKNFFEQDAPSLVIAMKRFGEWQNLIANQSSLPLIACQISAAIDSDVFKSLNFLKSRVGKAPVISPKHALVEDYIYTTGLNETHLHINGTTHHELLWLHSLAHPVNTTEQLVHEFSGNERVQLLYALNDTLSLPTDHLHLLRVARQAREVIICWAFDFSGSTPDKLKNQKKELCKTINDKNYQNNYFANESMLFSHDETYEHLLEIYWQAMALQKLKKKQDNSIDACLLLYITSMNCFQRLSVQRNDQYGFDQFQKFADGGSRNKIESYYAKRFHQLQDSYLPEKNPIASLECRFAPKDTNQKNIELLERLLSGFVESSNRNYLAQIGCINDLAKSVIDIEKPKLRVVAHFIKKKWAPSKDGTPHFQKLREDLIHRGYLLVELLDCNPNLKQIITGIDAAANELEAPPEVFSSLYRYCRLKGIQKFTYHAGEDFETITGGARAIYEAIHFLDLKAGDRIGHATAIGIHPDIWLSRAPTNIHQKLGDRLGDLIFARKALMAIRDCVQEVCKIEAELKRLFKKIFTDNEYSFEDLYESFDYRFLSPEAVKAYFERRTLFLTGWMSLEVKEVEKAISAVGERPLKLLLDYWFSESVMLRLEQLEEIYRDEFSSSVLIYIQQFVQHYVARSGVVIESLPTSNVRISHYNSIHEHHIFRWLKIKDRAIEGDANLDITLGSDDPGIFATTIKNEFYHVFCSLKEHFDCEPHKALEYVTQLNTNGRIYRFDYQE